jgi:hypothetical protein
MSNDAPDRDAIRARADAATEGPWHLRGRSIMADVLVSHDGPPETQWNNSVVCSVGAWSSGRPTDADAEFIVHARTDVPALLSALDERDDLLRLLFAVYKTWWYEVGGTEPPADLIERGVVTLLDNEDHDAMQDACSLIASHEPRIRELLGEHGGGDTRA